MKKILQIILIFLFSLTVISCAKKSSDDSKTTTTSSGLFVAVGEIMESSLLHQMRPHGQPELQEPQII